MELLKIDLTSITTNIEALVLAVLVLAGNRLLSWATDFFRDSNKLFLYKAYKAKVIKARLLELRLTLGAERACVFEFSNTERSLAGFPYTFMDMTHEDYDHKKIGSIAQYFRKVHVGNYPLTIGNIDKPEVRYRIYHNDEKDLPEEISDMMTVFGVRTSVMFRLHPNKLMYGTISLNFIDDYYRHEDDEVRPKHLSETHAAYLRDAANFILRQKEKPPFWMVSIFSKPKS